MNKILRYSFVAVLAIMGFGSAMADDVVIDFNALTDQGMSWSKTNTEEASTAGDITETWSKTFGTVTVEVSPKTSGSSENRFWRTNNGPQLRCYSGTITLKATQAMKAIVFEANGSNFSLSTNTGTLTEKTWTGDATEVVFTVSKNTQLNKITVNFDGDVVVPEPDPEPTVQTVTVAQAIEIANALDGGKTTTDDYIIKAYIVGDPTWTPYTDKNTGEIKNYNLAFYIGDTTGATETLYVYNAWNTENTYFPTQHESVVDGAYVALQGKLQKYVKNEVTTLELVKSHFLSYDGSTGITATKLNNAFEGAIYNVAGQKVDAGYKGLVIKGGKKMIQK